MQVYIQMTIALKEIKSIRPDYYLDKQQHHHDGDFLPSLAGWCVDVRNSKKKSILAQNVTDFPCAGQSSCYPRYVICFDCHF